MLAHQGEELLVPALIVALVLAGPMLKQRFAHRSHEPPVGPGPGVCAYCGAEVAEQDERCERCGFRVRR